MLSDGRLHSVNSYKGARGCRAICIIVRVLAVAFVLMSADVRAGNQQNLNCESLEYELLLNGGQQSIVGFDVDISILPIDGFSWEYYPDTGEIETVLTALIASKSVEWAKGSLSVSVQTEEHAPFMGDAKLTLSSHFTLSSYSKGQADFELDTSSSGYVSYWKRLFGQERIKTAWYRSMCSGLEKFISAMDRR